MSGKILPNESKADETTHSVYLLGIRQEKGLSVLEMADDWGVSPNTIYLWEHNKTNPPFATVIEMLDAYGFDVIIKRRE